VFLTLVFGFVDEGSDEYLELLVGVLEWDNEDSLGKLVEGDVNWSLSERDFLVGLGSD
jgi:hypothetical protein